MNWKAILGLGLTGALPPALALMLGGSPIVAAIAWTVLAALAWVPAILWVREPRPFVALVLVGVIAGVVAGVIDAVTLGDPMAFVIALVIGAAWGALFGLVAVGVRKLRSKRAAAMA